MKKEHKDLIYYIFNGNMLLYTKKCFDEITHLARLSLDL